MQTNNLSLFYMNKLLGRKVRSTSHPPTPTLSSESTHFLLQYFTICKETCLPPLGAALYFCKYGVQVFFFICNWSLMLLIYCFLHFLVLNCDITLYSGFSFDAGDRLFSPPVDDKFACNSDLSEKIYWKKCQNIILWFSWLISFFRLDKETLVL